VQFYNIRVCEAQIALGDLILLDKKTAVIFDVDGVLIDSVAAKGQAFVDLFAEFPEHSEAILELHRANGGVNRLRKFEMIHEQLLGVSLSKQRAAELAEAFSVIVLQKVMEAPEIPGASAALASMHARFPMHAVSATPNLELEQILRHHGMLHYFRSVHGVPPSKSVTVGTLIHKQRYSAKQCLFIGDSEQDAIAAIDNRTLFVQVQEASAPALAGASRTVLNLVGINRVIDELLLEVKV
jgi:phosphoglycolate phosphatase-like HAD superfamily hydrolase